MSVLFSIVIPVFNAQDFLPKCINSIIRQKRNNIEIIIIDDGSTDETPAICRRLLKTFPFVKLLTHSDSETRRSNYKIIFSMRVYQYENACSIRSAPFEL